MENAVIQGEYITFKHVKTRKVVVLEIEIPEEAFQDVISKLGMPIGGESKPVAVALLGESVPKIKIQTKGEKLRTKSVILCNDNLFKEWCEYYCKDEPRAAILSWCGVTSRAEIATFATAQDLFEQMLEKFDTWKFANQYSDNLSKY